MEMLAFDQSQGIIDEKDILDDYRRVVSRIRDGKRVGSVLYLHVDCEVELPRIVRYALTGAVEFFQSREFTYNVLKIGLRFPTLSLLNYPGFFKEAFPELASSAIYDFSTGKFSFRNYQDYDSRPILHRKELLLPASHPEIDRFATLTATAEAAGLFDNPARIGTSSAWGALLQTKNLVIEGHELLRSDGKFLPENSVSRAVYRYKTALKRRRMSLPIQKLQQFGLFDSDLSVFDYGCGRGDDLRLLKSMGISVSGWDPHYAPDQPKCSADIVNLGFVLNVIENPKEREETLREAFSLARRVLVIAVMVGQVRQGSKSVAYNDGVRTSRQTFQRVYGQREFSEFVECTLGKAGITVGSGISFVFKTNEDEQRFLAARAASRRAIQRPRISTLADVNAEYGNELDRFWQHCVTLGRVPVGEECEGYKKIIRLAGNSNHLFDLLANERDFKSFEVAQLQRRDDLLVEFALAEFGPRLFFKYFPEKLQHDIRAHFGGYSVLKKAARTLLFSVKDTDFLAAACAAAADDGIGYLLTDQALQLEKGLITELPALLRVYVGCAERLYGDLSTINLVKIHPCSGKVSFMGYDDFIGRPIPNLVERIKVKLWARSVDFYDYVGEFRPMPLLLKSLYLSENHEIYAQQTAFDRALMRINVFDLSRPYPSVKELHSRLAHLNLRIYGYELQKIA